MNLKNNGDEEEYPQGGSHREPLVGGKRRGTGGEYPSELARRTQAKEWAIPYKAGRRSLGSVADALPVGASGGTRYRAVEVVCAFAAFAPVRTR